MRWEVGDVSSKGTCWHTCLLGDRERTAESPSASLTRREGQHAREVMLTAGARVGQAKGRREWEGEGK